MEHDLIDRRLRAGRPDAAVPDDAFDPHLLAHVRTLPLDRRAGIPRRVAVPAAAATAVTAAAVVLFVGGPGGAGGPADAEAIAAQTLHWFAPPAGTVLHTRSVAEQGGRTTTIEVWQSADDPQDARERVDDPGGVFEQAADGLYDPATNTVYAGSDRGPDPGLALTGDPIVNKVRTLLQDGDMEVSGPVTHDGQETWAVSLKEDVGRPVWTLWVSTADGRPLELRDPGRDATEAPQTIQWPTYEVLSHADDDITVAGAHPDARVVTDPQQVDAAWDAIGPKTVDHAKPAQERKQGG